MTISPDDLRIDTYRATGHGGQYINKTDSAVRITHLPTGVVVTCQDQKSQLKNKEQAMKVLRSRLMERMRAEQHDTVAAQRRGQVGTGDRSERIRSANFREGRVTDHRLGLTLYRIDDIFDGDLDPFIDALRQQGVTDIIADPGFGFAKTVEQNYQLLARLDAFHALNVPLLVGVSRKRMIYDLLHCTPDQALNGTTVVNTMSLLQGAHILRVHDVKAAAEAVRLTTMLRQCSGNNDTIAS